MQNLLGILQPYKGVETVYLHNQDVGDIIQGILSTHDMYKSEYDKICTQFNARTNKQIAKNIWQYLKGNVKYVIEPDNKQMLKSPSAILATGHSTGSDCKNLSLFTGGVLDALNRKGKRINWVYRFASYRFNDRVPQHVFCVINPDTQNEIWIDAVLPTFNNKKQYFYKVDKKPKQMLVGLSGINTDLGIGRTKKSAKGVVDSAKKTARKKHFSKVKEQIKKRGRVVLKFAGAPARNAFLLLVKVNVRSLATNLKKLVQKNPDKLKRFWEGGGGNWNALLKEIERGAKKKRLLGVDNEGIGFEPTTTGVTAAIAAATPIIAKVVSLFKAAGIKGSDIAKVAGKIVQNKAKQEVESIDAAAKGEDIETEDEGGEGMEGIGARKKAGAKKAARQAKRAPKKAARKEKRTARKAKKAPKGGFGDEAEIDKIDKATTKKVKGAAIKKAATILKTAAESGLDLADTTSAAVQNVRQAAASYGEVANEAAAEEQAIEQKEAEQQGGGIDNKMLLIGGAVAVGALLLMNKKKR